MRIIENDASITSMQEILEQHCDELGLRKEDPILAVTERLRTLHRQEPPLDVRLSRLLLLSLTRAVADPDATRLQKAQIWSARQEILDEVACKMVPDDVLKKVSRSALVLFKERR